MRDNYKKNAHRNRLACCWGLSDEAEAALLPAWWCCCCCCCWGAEEVKAAGSYTSVESWNKSSGGAGALSVSRIWSRTRSSRWFRLRRGRGWGAGWGRKRAFPW